MGAKTIQKHIDRVVGTEGILRIPSWWMHKILSDLVQYCDSLESSDAGIKEYLESQLNLVGDAIEALDARVSEVESHELFAIVSELPSEPKANTIYLVPSANGDGNNILTEWVYVNGTWEQFGEFKADVDLSEYVKKADNPFEKGEANNSAVLKGGDNQVISKNGVALGNNNIVGLKGFYYKSIQFITNDGCRANIFISEQQVTPTIVSSSPTEGTSIDLKNYLSVGDTISIINDVKYENCATITEIFSSNSGFRVQFGDSYPFNEIKPETSLDVEDYSVYCLDKPDAGIVDLSIASFAAGRHNKAINNNATAFGFNNSAYGKFSFVEGRDNKAGYSAHAEGRENVASGEQSHAEGLSTEASGNHSHSEGQDTTALSINSHAEGNLSIASGVDSHAEGFKTKASGLRSHAEGSQSNATEHGSHVEGVSNNSEGVGSHAEGLYNIASGRASHVEGEGNKALGDRSHASGYKTITNNPQEVALGKFNKSIKDENKSKATQFSIGIGTSNTDRKNAFEVKQGGEHYIFNVGGYDGTNPTESKDLATVLNEINTKLTELSTDDIDDIFTNVFGEGYYNLLADGIGDYDEIEEGGEHE